MKFTRVLKADPANPIALLHQGQAQLALGQTEKSQQTLGEAAEKGTPELRTVALSNITELRASQAKFTLTRPNLAPLRQQMSDTEARETQAVAALSTRRDAGKDLIKSLDTRIENISYGVPDFSRVYVRPGGRLDAILKNLSGMSRSIDAAFGKASRTINAVGSLDHNKESGLVKDNDEILHELAAPLQLEPVPAQSLSVLPYYPQMLDDMALTDGDMIRALDASRSSLALLDVSLGDLNDFVQRLSHANFDYNNDISLQDYNALVGVGYPEDRYSTLQNALLLRVKNTGLNFETMQHDNLSPGEVAAASIVAADTNTTPEQIITESQTTNRRIVDVANARGMRSEALEIFLGLVYLDYVDDPVKEAAGH